MCCYSNQLQSDVVGQKSAVSFNSDKINTVRQKMLAGQRPDECAVCYRAEDIGVRSARQTETDSWLVSDSGRLAMDNNVRLFMEGKKLEPVSLDLRYSNTCTLKCRMCNSGSSSSINQEYAKLQQQWPGKFWTVDNPRTKHDIAITTDIQKVYLAGGEPLVEPYNLELLSRLAECNPDVNLVINTSLNHLSDKFLVVLNRFRRLTLAVSLDGTDQVNDYIRHGSDFATVKSNIATIKHHIVLFTSCVSIYNIFSIRDLVEFVAAEYPDAYQNHSLNIVVDLEELLVDNVPPELRPELIDYLTATLSVAGAQAKIGIQNLIVTLQQDNFDPVRFESFKRYTKILDTVRNESIVDIDPRWAKYFN